MEELKVQKREVKGRKTEKLREKGFVPAVVYGPETPSQKLTVEERRFERVFRRSGEASLIKLKIGGDKKPHPVLVREFQLDPLTDRFIHVDFYQPILTEKIETNVPLEFVGEAPAVKEKEGVLVRNMTEIQVSALPTELPSVIKVDISILEELDDSVQVKDLDIPPKVEVFKKEDEIVATVSAPKTAEELIEEMERKEEEELFVGEEVPLEPSVEGEEVVEGGEGEEIGEKEPERQEEIEL